MHKAGAIFFLLLIVFPVLLTAQDDDGDGWDYYDDGQFAKGDQTFIISLGTVFPMVFVMNGKAYDHKIDPPVGGLGSLAYNYYITPQLFLGGELSGMFMPTLGGNTLYVIPIGFRAGYQFNVWRLEFPVSAALGVAWHRYLNNTYFGIYMKAGGAAYFRITQLLSIGINTNWYWLPEWTSDRNKNVDGNLLDLTLSARIHF